MWTAGITFVTLVSVSFVRAGMQCVANYCDGDRAYCCGTFNEMCCWQTVSVVELWWFWFIWVCLFIGILSCTIWICVRRRRASAGYIIFNQQPTYQSTASVTTAYSQPPPNYSTVAAPAYTPTYQTHPAHN